MKKFNKLTAVVLSLLMIFSMCTVIGSASDSTIQPRLSTHEEMTVKKVSEKLSFVEDILMKIRAAFLDFKYTFDRVTKDSATIAVTYPSDFELAHNGDDISLSNNIDCSDIIIGRAVDINLNGHTVTCKSFSYSSDKNLSVSVKNGIIKSTSGNVEINIPNGTVSLSDLTVVLPDSSCHFYVDASTTTVNLGDNVVVKYGDSDGEITINADTSVCIADSVRKISPLKLLGSNISVDCRTAAVSAGKSVVEITLASSDATGISLINNAGSNLSFDVTVPDNYSNEVKVESNSGNSTILNVETESNTAAGTTIIKTVATSGRSVADTSFDVNSVNITVPASAISSAEAKLKLVYNDSETPAEIKTLAATDVFKTFDISLSADGAAVTAADKITVKLNIGANLYDVSVIADAALLSGDDVSYDSASGLLTFRVAQLGKLTVCYNDMAPITLNGVSYTSLAQAYADANSGDTIILNGTTFTDTLNIKKSITIEGKNAGTPAVTKDAEGRVTGVNTNRKRETVLTGAISVSGSDIDFKLDGCTLKNQVNASNTGSLTVVNCVNDNRTGTVTIFTASQYTKLLEVIDNNCFIGKISGNLMQLWSAAKDGSSVSSNYFSADCSNNNLVNFYNFDANAEVSISYNYFAKAYWAGQISPQHNYTATVTFEKNTLADAGTLGMDSIFFVSQSANDGYTNMTLKFVSNNVASATHGNYMVWASDITRPASIYLEGQKVEYVLKTSAGAANTRCHAYFFVDEASANAAKAIYGGAVYKLSDIKAA